MTFDQNEGENKNFFEGDSVVVCTYNVRSLRNLVKHNKLSFLLRRDVDIFVLTEVQASVAQLQCLPLLCKLLQRFSCCAWNVATKGRAGAGYSGVAVLSTKLPKFVRFGMRSIGALNDEGCVLTFGFTDISLVGLYKPSTSFTKESAVRRRRFELALATHLRQLLRTRRPEI